MIPLIFHQAHEEFFLSHFIIQSTTPNGCTSFAFREGWMSVLG